MTNPDNPTYPDPEAVAEAAAVVEGLRSQLTAAEERLYVQELLAEVAAEEPTDQPTHPQEEPMQTDPAHPNLDDPIAQAERGGDWGRAGMLKLEKLAQPSPEAPPATDPALLEEIRQAESEGRWLDSGLMKVRLTQTPETPQPFSPELAAAIAEAEQAGDWGRAGMLKCGALRIEEAH
jgi:hypothetical protein